MARSDDHGELANLQASGNWIGGECHCTPRTILGVCSSGGFMSHVDLALNSLGIVLCSRCGRVRKGGVHVGRR